MTGAMKYLLPCKCGQSVEVVPSQAGQEVVCACGETLLVPSMLQVKALLVAPEKPVKHRSKKRTPYISALTTFGSFVVCLVLTVLFRWSDIWQMNGAFWCLFVLLRGLTGSLFFTSVFLAIRDWIKSPLAEDTAMRRTFFVIGVVLLYPTLFLASYLYEWQPKPLHATLGRVEYTFSDYKRPIIQNSTPISPSEHIILRMRDEDIDRMMPMDLYLYFLTLEEPTFSFNFQDNYEAVKDTYRIWVTGTVIVFVLSILSIVASFFMPRHTVVVTGWSGSDWQSI